MIRVEFDDLPTRWLAGTHHGVGADHLDAYFQEFAFRFNRRFYPMAGFATLLGLSAELPPTIADAIHGSLPAGQTARRRGRTTGLTSTRRAAIQAATAWRHARPRPAAGVAPTYTPACDQRRPSRVTRRARGWLLAAVATLILALLIVAVGETFVAQPYRIEQVSMETTLLPGQSVLVDKLTPDLDGYQRGDIVVFTPPGAAPGATPFIKRVIGLPGDTIALRNGHVVINGQEINEPYVYAGQPTEPRGQDHWVVPPDALFVMGDHRELDNDSRIFGPVPLANVIGRVWLRYWPLAAVRVLATPSYPTLTPPVPAASPAAVDSAPVRARAA